MSLQSYRLSRAALACSLALACAPRSGAPSRARAYADAIADPARPEEDRERDAIRRPREYLALIGAAPGDRVLELGAGFGYMALLVGLVVGPKGHVVAHNPPDWAAFPSPAWARGREAALAPGVWRSHVAPWDDPIPPGARFELVLSSFAYHEAVIAGADRATMNQAVFAALEPGGRYVVADHHAAPGTPMSEVARLHRIDAARVEAELAQAGFELVARSDLYSNPQDALDEPTCCEKFPGAQHRFILVMRRPAP